MNFIYVKIMIIDCISDLHGYFPFLLGGDLLIIAGDLTAYDKIEEYQEFIKWLAHQEYKKKVVIAGNHDHKLEDFKLAKSLFSYIPLQNTVYLMESSTEYDGLHIWGSPFTKRFKGQNHKASAFTSSKKYMDWARIPDDVDILITHGPPYAIYDSVNYEIDEPHVGCKRLRKRVLEINPKLHVFGHIHECGGKMIDRGITKFCNASIVNERYQMVNKPVRIEI